MRAVSRSTSRRLALTTLLVLLLTGGVELAREARGSGEWLLSFSPGWSVTLALYGLLGGLTSVMLTAEIARPGSVAGRFAVRAAGRRAIPPWLGWLAAGLIVLLPVLVLLGPWGRSIAMPAIRSLLAITCAGLAGLLLPKHRESPMRRLLLSALAIGLVFAVAKRLVLVTDYPFKLAWSEGNRLWDYSLYFRWNQYGFPTGTGFPGYLTPGRHGLWGLPFVFRNLTIGAQRLWDALLWIWPYLLLGWGLVRRFGSRWSRTSQVGGLAWAFLYLTSGGIFAPLALSACLMVWAYRPQRTAWNMGVAAIAGCYAGLSRWTWLPAPAAWAVMLVLLGSHRDKAVAARIRQAAPIGAVGLLGGLASQWMMTAAFPRPDAVFSTALSQPLLWYRLLPSPTNSIGVLPALVLVVGPPVALMLRAVRSRNLPWTWLERLFAALVIAVLVGAGLAASAKIGGGSNLHNADMLLVTVLILAAIVAAWLDADLRKFWDGLPEWGRVLAVLALVVPALDAVRTGSLPDLPAQSVTAQSLATVQREAGAAASRGPVLFIDQRQLYTFGQIRLPSMVMEYELKDAMNQALSANQAFFEQFRQDLQQHRFSLIVSDPLPSQLQGRSHQFGEENDAWLTWVATPLRDYYRPSHVLDEVGIWLLIPAEPEQP